MSLYYPNSAGLVTLLRPSGRNVSEQSVYGAYYLYYCPLPLSPPWCLLFKTLPENSRKQNNFPKNVTIVPFYSHSFLLACGILLFSAILVRNCPAT